MCKQWRDAGNLEEPLQLYVDLRHMSDAEVSSFSAWMSLHGHQVGALVIGANPSTAVPGYGWLVESAAALRRLTRLEVSHKDSLALLAPVLGQLTQLQCLAVDIELMLTREPSDGPGDGSLIPRFSVAQQPWEELPDMQQNYVHSSNSCA